MKKIIEYIKLFVYESKLKRSKKRIFRTKNKIKKNKEDLEKLNKKLDMQNKKYDKSQKYYLVAFDDKNDIEVLRHEIIMDIAFADDFGFFG